MSLFFTIFDEDGTGVEFNRDEAADTGHLDDHYSFEMGVEKSAGAELKTQIRPGLRFERTYEMALEETKYISFFNLIRNNSDDYFIEYETAPSILANNPEIITTNNFRIAFQIQPPKDVRSKVKKYVFDMTISSVEVL